MNKKAAFGFQIVNEEEKQKKVQNVFTEVSARYDLMNDLMSFGLHRIWKEKLISEINPQQNDVLLDLAGGTGDISRKFINKGGKKAVVCDLNSDMLQQGVDKSIDCNFKNINSLEWVCANAEDLPFEDNSFDYCTISFGIRNVTHIDLVLKEAHRILKPGGKFLCLEFSNVTNDIISKIYNAYSFHIIPKLGKLIAGSSDNYQYLVESIRMFPKAQIFANKMKQAGFEFVEFTKMTFGVVAIHSGCKTS